MEIKKYTQLGIESLNLVSLYVTFPKDISLHFKCLTINLIKNVPNSRLKLLIECMQWHLTLPFYPYINQQHHISLSERVMIFD